MSEEAPHERAAADVRQFTVTDEDDGIRLDRWFSRHLPGLGFGVVARWARTGQIRVDGRRATPGDRVAAGQTIRVPPDERKTDAAASRHADVELTADEVAFARSLVIHRDEHAIVINKPAGLATQGGTRTTVHLDRLLGALAPEREGRPKLVHRLDKDTSGVLLLARSAAAAGFFSKAFAGRTARKVYWALVVGVPSPEEGLIDLALAKQPGTGGEKMHVVDGGQPARTRYRLVERAGNRAAWLELQPLTGRTHQIRVHAAALGHPVVGDAKYGGRDAFLTGGISRKLHLHARRLVIDHPSGGMLDITADPAPHIAESFATLGFELAAGDLPLVVTSWRRSAEGKARAEAAAARERRRERRGERRRRG